MKQIAMWAVELIEIDALGVMDEKSNIYIPKWASDRQIDVVRVLIMQKYGNYVRKSIVEMKNEKWKYRLQ